MPWWIPLAVAGANAVSGAVGAKSSNRSNRRFTREIQRRQYEYNRLLTEQQQAFQRDMWQWSNAYNHPKNEVARLLSAGINPALAFSNGGASAAPVPNSGSAGGVSSPVVEQSNPLSGVSSGIASGLQAAALESQVKVNDSLSDKYAAEADESRSRSGVNSEQERLTRLNADLLEKTKDTLVEHSRLRLDLDRLSYSMGYNALIRDNIYTSNFPQENSMRLERMRLDNRLARKQYDLLVKHCNLLVSQQKLTEQQAREVSVRAQILVAQRYVAQWNANFARVFNESVYGSSASPDAGSAAFQNVLASAKKEIANLVQSSLLGEVSLQKDYEFQVEHGSDYRFYGFEDLRRGANQRRTSQYTSVINSLFGAASSAITAVSTARFRGAMTRSLNQTNRQFGGTEYYPYYDFEPSE